MQYGLASESARVQWAREKLIKSRINDDNSCSTQTNPDSFEAA